MYSNTYKWICASVLLIFTVLAPAELKATPASPVSETQRRLEHGEVVVDMQEIGATKYVTGKIIIDEPVDHVWTVLTNPFEYAHQIYKRMKGVEVVLDSDELSQVKCLVQGGFLLPDLSYTVESRYKAPNRVDFRRLSGNIKDFKGYWQIEPSADHKQTELTYSTYIDPGFPLPQWVIREGVKMELPKSMLSLRDRVNAIYKSHASPEPQSIIASHISKDKLLASHETGAHF